MVWILPEQALCAQLYISAGSQPHAVLHGKPLYLAAMQLPAFSTCDGPICITVFLVGVMIHWELYKCTLI